MLDKEKTCKAFSRAAKTYDAYASFQQSVARQLISYLTQPPLSVLDIGCGTGEVLFQLSKLLPDIDYQGLDLSSEMILAAEKRSIKEKRPEIIFTQGDMEKMDYPDESFDLVTCSLALQWLNDPKLCFSEIRRVLKPQGTFVFATLLPGSLQEIGSQHPFRPRQEIIKKLHHFIIEDCAETKQTTHFKTFRELVDSIRNVGAKTQAKRLTPTQLKKLEKNYPRTQDGLPLSYQVLFVRARKS